MVEIKFFKTLKSKDESATQEPFRQMVVPFADLDMERKIITVPTIDGKDVLQFYFVEFNSIENNGHICYELYSVDLKS